MLKTHLAAAKKGVTWAADFLEAAKVAVVKVEVVKVAVAMVAVVRGEVKMVVRKGVELCSECSEWWPPRSREGQGW